MNPTQFETIHCLNAARGWLDLGNPTEATLELDKVSPACRFLPEVLEVRWQIFGKMQWWTAALEMASALTEIASDRASGWVLQAYSLRQLKQTARACEKLAAARERFPEVATIPFYLACFNCHLKKPDEAWSWLQRAMATTGSSEVIAALALEEADLKPLWDRIRSEIKPVQPAANSNASESSLKRGGAVVLFSAGPRISV